VLVVVGIAVVSRFVVLQHETASFWRAREPLECVSAV